MVYDKGTHFPRFFFILAMEELHVSMLDAIQESLFCGAKVGELDWVISHLLYADDIIFLGEWIMDNISNIVRLLHCFYLVSGL